MKTPIIILSVALGLFGPTLVYGTETFDEALQRASLDYAARLRQAGEELAKAREDIAAQKAPVLKATRAAEDRIISAEEETTQLETAQAQAQEKRMRLIKDAELLRKNIGYLSTLSQDSLKEFNERLAPGEAQSLQSVLADLQHELSDTSNVGAAKSAPDVARFFLSQVQQSLGGHSAPGRATLGEDNQVVKGVFAFMGPETYFRADENGVAGIVTQLRDESAYPTVHPLTQLDPATSRDFFQGKLAELPTDSTAGKALKLRQTQGTVWHHVQKGGVVAYAIIGVGFIAFLLILQKTLDLGRMAVDRPDVVRLFLERVVNEGPSTAEQHLSSLKRITRNLFSVGLRSVGESKVVLEERLQAVILRERLHYERRLPLLAVIATAAPLMGLLGTVMGMVRTFALITVFGTGNAGKLASGISEVLVTTELGLLVAIPTLVAHGLLAQHLQKNLALLERYALEFVTANQAEVAADNESISR